ncbi:MAG: PAS domain S-box protein [Candidatus Krumholzibacteriota bacterium]|nr:PAS domain S-box protein [Candidatus Krumholzibacteriota bacterium]
MKIKEILKEDIKGFLEQASVRIAVLDTEFNIVWANRYYTGSAGLSPGEIEGNKCYAVWGLDKPCGGCPVIEAIETGEPQEAELTSESQMGYLSKASPLRDENGDIIGAIDILFDITGSKKRECLHRETNEKFSKMYENIPLPYHSLDKNGCFIDVNPAWVEMLGYENDEVTGKNFAEFLHPDSKRQFDKHFPELKKRGYIHDAQFRIRHKDGHYLFMSFEGRIGYDPGGRFKQTYCVMKDITRHKKLESTLRDKEKRWRNYVKKAPYGIFVADMEGNYVEVNPAASGITGYTEEELLNMSIHDLLPANSMEMGVSHFQRLCEEEYSDEELPFKDKNGNVKYWRISAVKMNRDRFLGFVQETTGQRKAELRLRESEETYRDLFHNVQVGLFRTKIEDGMILESNQQMARMFGYSSREELIGSYITSENYVDPGTRERMVEEIRRNGKINNFEARFYRKDGSIFYARYSAKIYPDKGWIEGVCEDITERKKMEEKRNELQSQLIQATKMESVGRLAGGVAHDHNNMLSVILGYTELILGKLKPDNPLYRDLLEIQKAAERSRDITRQLLAFARKQTIDPEVMGLNDTIEDMLKMLKQLIGENVDLAWMPEEEIWNVKVDKSQIDQVLVNLCVNARDAIGGNGKIIIETENVFLDEDYCGKHAGFTAGEFVMLAVSDDGVGIDKNELDNIFEPYYTTKDSEGSAGLGLAMIYGVMKQNRGFINVYSELGRGTTVKCYFPRHKGEGSKANEESTDGGGIGGGETILVVEDENSVLELIRLILEKLGYSVLTASTAGEAFELAAENENKIKLLISDVIMPEMNGSELADKLKSHYPDIKILFMSGYTKNVIAEKGVLDEGVNFIQKPFSKIELGKKINQLLSEE